MPRVRLSIASRRDVGTSRQAETLDVVGHLLARLEDHDLGLCSLERLDIVRTRSQRARRVSLADREGYARTSGHQSHVMESPRLARSMSSINTPPEARGWMNATLPSAPRRGP